MPRLHVDKLRTGDGGEDEYRVVETTALAVWETDAALGVVGRGLPRVEGPEKVTGRARYAYDVRLPGQLYARVLRSPLPHARIRAIDTRRAQAAPGVRAVISAADAPDIAWYDGSALFDRTVRFVGEEVAAVAADSEERADDALALIGVDYEPLPFVLTIEAALQPGAPEVRDGGNIVGQPERYRRGDAEAGLRRADVVVDEVYTTQTALHNCLEPHGCTAAWEGERLVLWDSTQAIFDVREEVAGKLGLPEHRVRVVKQHMGGGFGSKQVAWKHTVIAALLARRAGRPVQLMLDREAENLAAGNRNTTRQRVRLGATRDGTLTAIAARIEQAAGAYMVGGEASDTGAIFQTLYRCPDVSTEQLTVYTNTGPAVAFRAPGHVEGAFALESAMDELARALDMDPLELRRRNHAREDQQKGRPYTSPDSLPLCCDRVADAFGWRARRKPAAAGPRRLFALPTDAHRTETRVAADELVVSLRLPALAPGTRSTYLKAMDRRVWAFAVVGVSARMRLDGRRIADARLTLSGVAPVPWRAPEAERQLAGAEASEHIFERTAATALAHAAPLRLNAYKAPLARALVRRALTALAAEGGGST